MLRIGVLTVYALCSAALTVYAIHHFVLLFLLWRHRARWQRIPAALPETEDDWPTVTTHIPLYNEAEVAERVIDSVAALDYPRTRHQILVLDDSTDETRALVDSAVRRWQRKGVDIQVQRRRDRTGYKAGALAEALTATRGEFIAIFDADFVPPPHFLRRVVANLLARPDAACMQARWEHLNRDQTGLTRSQGLAIDGHFMVEQTARCAAGLFLNFNGTAGIWRRAAIEDPRVGGWQHDTVTEDLDLSYRVQMAGWRIAYDHTLTCPAELPANIPALRVQQRRWARGSIQTAVKLLGPLWRSPLPLRIRVAGAFHLLAYTNALWMVGLAVSALPVWCFWAPAFRNPHLWPIWVITFMAGLAPPLMYLVAAARLGRLGRGLRHTPVLMVLGAGLCLDSAIAGLDGFRRRGGVFERTPKTGTRGDHLTRGRYRAGSTPAVNWMELAAGFYTAAGTLVLMIAGDWAPALFMGIYATGFLTVAMSSILQRESAAAGRRPTPARRRPVVIEPQVPALPPAFANK